MEQVIFSRTEALLFITAMMLSMALCVGYAIRIFKEEVKDG